MSNKPRGTKSVCELTMREWTAISAMQGLLSAPGEEGTVVQRAIDFADQLIATLEGTDSKFSVPQKPTPPETLDWRDVNICMLFNEGSNPMYAFLRSCGISTCGQLNDMVCGGAEGFAYLSCAAHQELRTLLARYQTKCGVKR